PTMPRVPLPSIAVLGRNICRSLDLREILQAPGIGFTDRHDQRTDDRGLQKYSPSAGARRRFRQPRRRALVRAPFLAAAERAAAPLVRAAWRADAERCPAVRLAAAPCAWRDSARCEAVLCGSRFSAFDTAREIRGRRRVLRFPCPAS